MSIISAFHNVEVATKDSKPFTNQRLVTLHYKSRTVKYTGKVNSLGLLQPAIIIPKFPSLCVSIPQLVMNIPQMPAAAQSVTLSLWENLQDDLIRSLIDARRSKDENGNPTAISAKRSVSTDEIDLPAVAAFAAATGNGKLSSEGIGQWFDQSLAENILTALMIADTNGNTRDDATCTAILSSYRDGLCKLAAVVPNITQANIQQLRKAILKAPEEDQMAPRLLAKLDVMDKSRNAAVLADLL